MGLAEAFMFLAINILLVPKTRNDVPFMQMGFDLDQLALFIAEVVLYQASFFEAYKAIACAINNQYGYEKGWCPLQNLAL